MNLIMKQTPLTSKADGWEKKGSSSDAVKSSNTSEVVHTLLPSVISDLDYLPAHFEEALAVFIRCGSDAHVPVPVYQQIPELDQ